jgi:prepilin-type N-terminal cleavage/methylation domain-containing protein
MARAFTLVELLVVVSIIVILLALLAPVLDRAIYQAELASCGANLHTIAGAVTIYAFDHKRQYPHRPGVFDPDAPFEARMLADVSDNGVDYDDRPSLRPFTSLKVFLDPLCPTIDLDAPQISPGRHQKVMSSYYLWYGWQWPGRPGMIRLGNHFSVRDPRTDLVYSYDWIATDRDFLSVGTAAFASHPDALAVLSPRRVQEEQINSDTWATHNAWTLAGGGDHQRGTIDFNAASADGAVIRYNTVPLSGDSRMTKVWNGSRATNMPPQDGVNGAHLPKRWN